MPQLQYDLSTIADIVELEDGKVKARLVACTKGKSRASDKPLLTWQWLILTGPNKGQQARTWTTLQENALFGLKQHLLALGFKKSVNADTDDLLGKKVILVIGKRPRTLDNGSTILQSGVQAVLPLKGESDEEEDEAPAPKAKKKVVEADEDDDEEPAPKAKKKPVVEDDDEDEEEPKPKKALKTVGKPKKAKDEDDDDDNEPF